MVKKNVASHHTDEERTMANEHMTKYLLFLVIKKVNSSYTEKQFTTSNEQRLTVDNLVLGRAQWHGHQETLLLGE